MNTTNIEAWMLQNIAESLQCQESDLDPDLPFTALGLDSVSILGLAGDLAEFTNQDIQASVIWEFPTIALLAAELAKNETDSDDLQPIIKPTFEHAPLTFSQELIWRHANHSEQGDDNLINHSWILRGPLERTAFLDSLIDITKRHTILRTSFEIKDDVPVQSVREDWTLNLSEYDLSSTNDPVAEANELLDSLGQQSISIKGRDLFQIHLIKIHDLEHRILFRLHHLLYDANSLKIFYEELRSFYNAHLKGETIPEDHSILQVIEFAQRQRKRLATDTDYYKQMETWWRKYWTRPPFPKRLKCLPIGKKRGAKNTTGSKTSFENTLSPALTQSIQDRAKTNGVTEYMVYFAGFISLMHAYGNRSPFTIGSYISDRSDPAAQHSIGFFINLLALRIEPEKKPNGHSVIEISRRTISEGTINQELPFELLAESLEADGYKRPQFDVIFQLIPSLINALQLEHLETSSWRDTNANRNTNGFIVDILEAGNTRSVRMRFDSERYAALKVERMLKDYFVILEQIAIQPEKSIPSFKRFSLFS